MDTQRDLNADGWPPRPWDLEWAMGHTTLPTGMWGALDRDEPDPDPVADSEPCAWCDQTPASPGGWAPGEMFDHVRDAHPELMPKPSPRTYAPRESGTVLPPAP